MKKQESYFYLVELKEPITREDTPETKEKKLRGETYLFITPREAEKMRNELCYKRMKTS